MFATKLLDCVTCKQVVMSNGGSFGMFNFLEYVV